MSNIARQKSIQKHSILTASAYRARINSKQPLPTSEQIYESLLHYEKTIKIVEAALKLTKLAINKLKLKQAFTNLHTYSENHIKTDYTEEQIQLVNKKIFKNERIQEELIQIIQQKIDNEAIQQKTLIQQIKEQFFQDQQKLVEKATNLGQKLNLIIKKQLNYGYNLIKQINLAKKQIIQDKNTPIVKKVILNNMGLILNKNLKAQKKQIFKYLLTIYKKQLIKQEAKSLGLQEKGTKLLNLNKYPSQTLRKTFWRWYLVCTDRGQDLLARAANNLVLYTNINNITVFYRLLAAVNGTRRKIPPRIRKIISIMNVSTKVFIERIQRDFFNILKQKLTDDKAQIAFRLLKNSRMRARFALKIWKQNIKKQQKIQQIFKKQNDVTKNSKILQVAKKIINCSVKRKRDIINKWYKQIKDIKIKDLRKTISQQQKKYMLKMLDNLIHYNKHQQLRNIISKFKTNSRMVILQRNFLKRMLQSKIGLVIMAFREIKGLPQRQSFRHDKRANPFQRGLTDYANRVLRKAFNSFIEQNQQAQNLKKRAVMQLMDMTMSKRKRMFNRWKVLAVNNQLIDKCKRMSQIMNGINLAIKSVTDNAFADNKEIKLKEKAILKIMGAFREGLDDSFNKWRQLSRIHNLRKTISQQQKKYMLKMLDNLIHYNKHQQLRNIISKFKTNSRMVILQRNFLKRMLQSKIGLVIMAFREIKGLPQRQSFRHDKRANPFQRGLSDYANRVLRKAFNSFIEQNQQAQNLKKRAVMQLMDMTMSKRKRMFNRWKVLAVNNQLIDKCKRMSQIMNGINLAIKSVTDNAFADNKEIKLKEKAILKIMGAFREGLDDSFNKWRELSRIHNLRKTISQQQKKYMLKMLDNLIHYNKHQQLRNIISKFKTNSRMVILQRNFLKRMLQSKIGLVIMAFREIKGLPQRQSFRHDKRANPFQRGLSDYANRVLRKAFNSFIEQNQQAQNLKKRAVMQLMDMTMSKRKRMFNRWKVLAVNNQLIDKCKRMSQIMNGINLAIKSVTDNAFADNKEIKLKEKAILKIMGAFREGLDDSFNKWRELSRIHNLRKTISQQQKKYMLKMLDNLIHYNKHQQLRNIISKFKTNSRMVILQRNFLKRMLQSKIGLVIMAYREIKGLPQRQSFRHDKRANPFQRGLSDYANRVLRKAFNSFIEQNQQAQNLKKRAVMQLMDMTMSKRKRMFNRWKVLAVNNQLIDKCKRMSQIMNGINLAIKSVTDNAFADNKEIKLKEKAILKIMGAFREGLDDSFNKWRELSRIHNLRKTISQQQKKYMLKMLDNLIHYNKHQQLRNIISKFKTNSRMVILQRNFLKRMLQSKIGLVIMAFREIKGLPQRQSFRHDKRANPFQRGLSDYANRVLRKAFNSFIEQNQQAQNLKKRAVMQLMDMTMSKRKCMFNRWKVLAVNNQLIDKCKRMSQIMNGINLAIKSVTDNAFADNKEIKLKEKAILKIMGAFREGLDDSFNKWRELSRIHNLRKTISQQQKKYMLKMLDNLIHYNKHQQLRNIISKFKTNSRMVILQRNFLKRMLQSKIGLVIMAFREIKGLPQRQSFRHDKRANPFQRGLSDYANRVLRKAFNSFIEQNQQAQNLKKRAVMQLMDMTMSKRKRMFNRWKVLAVNNQLIDKCKRMSQIMNGINLAIKSVTDNAFADNKEIKLKEKAILKIMGAFREGLDDSFNKWRELSRIHNLRKTISQQQKKYMLKMLDNLIHYNKHQQLRNIISKFKTNSRMVILQRNFLKRMLQSKIGLVIMAFREIKGLPQRQSFRHDKRANPFQRGLSDYANRVLRKAFNSFIEQNQQAQNLKKRAVMQLMDMTMSKRKCMFNRWKVLAVNNQLIDKCKRMSQIMNGINLAIKSVTDNAFADNKEIKLKEKAILKIMGAFREGLDDSFNKWRELSRIHNLRKTISQQQKKYMLKMLDNLIHYNKHQQLRNIISKFKTNSRMVILQRNFLKRMLQSKIGLVIMAFREIKGLPQRQSFRHDKRANPFQRGLSDYANRVLRKAFNSFIEQNQQAQNLKKRAVMQLMDMTMSKRKCMFNRWKVLAVNNQLIDKCKRMSQIMNGINLAIKSVTDNAFADNKEIKLKEKAILKIMGAFREGLDDSFNKWRELSRIHNLRKTISQQQKKYMLKMLDNLIHYNKHQQLRNIISKFKTNSRMVILQRNFLKRMLQSKIGLVIMAFREIKGLPQRQSFRHDKRANPFQRGLSDYANRVLRKAFNSFIEQNQQAQNLKKRAVMQLMDMTMSKRKRMFNRWKVLAVNNQLIDKCKRMSQIMNGINLAIKSVTDNAFADNKEIKLKEKAILKIMGAFREGLDDSFNKWRELSRIHNLRKTISQQQKKYMLKMLDNLIHYNKHQQLRNIISKFKTNSRMVILQRNFLKRMLQSKIGLVIMAFREIKGLPQRQSFRHDKRANPFQRGLSDYANRVLRKAFNSFIEQNQQAQNLKKRAVMQLMDMTMSKRKRMFNRWKVLAVNNQLIDKCKRMSQIMNGINLAIKSVTDNAFADNKEIKLKEKAILKIMGAFREGLDDSFNKWRELSRIHNLRKTISQQQKKYMLKMLDNLIHYNKHQQLRNIISKFKTNSRMVILQRNFLKRMLQSKIGLVIMAFREIKGLPQRQSFRHDKRANPFQRGLSDYANRVLRKAFNSFIEQNQQAQNLKKRAVMQLMDMTMSKRKRMFNRWKVLAVNNQLIDKCKRMSQIMNGINLAIKSVTDNAFADNKEIKLKEKAILKIMGAFREGLDDSFNKWRELSRIHNLRKTISQQQKKYMLKMLDNLIHYNKHQQLRNIISKFKTNSRMVILQRNFLKRMLQSKIGLVIMAFREIKGLPQRHHHFLTQKANYFQQGLFNFFIKKLRKSFQSFKSDYHTAQNIKKQSIIQLFNCTMSNRKKLFNQWKYINQNALIALKCKYLTKIIPSINDHIKSVADNAFIIQTGIDPIKTYKYNILDKVFNIYKKNAKQSFRLWRQNNNKLKLQQIFKGPTHILTRNKIDQILPQIYYRNAKLPKIQRQNYQLNQVQYIVKYFLRLLRNKKQVLKQVFQVFRQIPQHTPRINPWFKKSAAVLSLNTRVNIQKSFWRMISNSQTPGIAFNTAIIVKLKKMYNNIKKAYILNMYHAFLLIDRKSTLVQKQMQNYYDNQNQQQDKRSSKSRDSFSYNELNNYHSRSRNSLYFEQRKTDNSNLILPQVVAQIRGQQTKKISVKMMSRIFNKFMKQRVNIWYDKTFPVKKYTNLIKNNQPTNLYITRLGAIQSIFKLSNKYLSILLQKSFYKILQKVTITQSNLQHELNINQITDSLNRQQLLLDQIRYYKQQYQSVCFQLQQKQQALKQADNMITVLSLRNNYIITQKFIASIQQVYYSVNERYLDEGFDAIMQQANRNYETQPLQPLQARNYNNYR